MHSYLDRILLLNKEQYTGYKKFTNLNLNETDTESRFINFDKLSMTTPSAEIDCANNNCLNAIIGNDGSVVNNMKIGNNNYNNRTTKIKINTVDINIADNKISHSDVKNKKQRNVSFSNEKLWEINRVNRILHNKISNGVKPNYSNKNHSQIIVRATSTINREKKNRDIERGNEVSYCCNL